MGDIHGRRESWWTTMQMCMVQIVSERNSGPLAKDNLSAGD